jgi:hypothetical protein
MNLITWCEHWGVWQQVISTLIRLIKLMWYNKKNRNVIKGGAFGTDGTWSYGIRIEGHSKEVWVIWIFIGFIIIHWNVN